MKINIKQFVNKYRRLADTLGIATIVAMFYVIKIMLIRTHSSSKEIIATFNSFILDKPSACGILTEIQIMLVVCMTIWYGKPGYITSLILCGTSVMTHIIPVFFGGTIISLIGMIMIIGGAVISTIVYVHRKHADKQKDQLHKMATYDSLTGLVNRRTFFEQLNILIGNKEKMNDKPFAIVFIDIDDFKKVNDLTGHGQGDLLLQQVVRAWEGLIAEGDLLGRIGGDEFALIITHAVSNEEIQEYIEQLKSALEKSIEQGMCSHNVTASFGVSKYPQDAETANQLLKYADTAMYVAKANGKNGLKFFSKEMYEGMARRTQLENGLAQAISNQELYLMYQPQYGCHEKKLRGFEVLLRWNSKELGFISPAEFIPLAEKTGLIVSIGEWVLETACRQFKAIGESYGMKTILSVNISALQLLEPNFVAMVKEVLEKTDFNPRELEFEITESVFISSKEYIISVLNEIKALGIHIALDDFGTNYASLSYIQMLPLDVLKIDKSFIDHIIDENKKTNLVGAIISIAQQLNYKVVAEGIEKQEQIQYLNEKGCDYVQGYLWGKPLIETDVKKLLHSLASE